VKPTISTKDAEKKKAKKKEKKHNRKESTEQNDNVTQDIPVDVSNAEELKERKKKKKSRKAHSSSTTTIPDDSTSGKQLDPPQDVIHEADKSPSKENASGPNNESSNSCLQPPSNKVLLETFLCIRDMLFGLLFFYYISLCVFPILFRYLSQRSPKYLNKNIVKRLQSLSTYQRGMHKKKNLLLIRLLKAVLKEPNKIFPISK
jgi:hypothetical protein